VIRRSSLLVSTALGTVLGVGATLAPQAALASCIGSTVVVCFGNEPNGRTVNLNGDKVVSAAGWHLGNGNGSADDALRVNANDHNLVVINLFGNSVTAHDGDGIDMRMGSGNLLAVNGLGGPIVVTGWGEGLQIDSTTGDIDYRINNPDDTISVDRGTAVRLRSTQGGDINFETKAAVTSRRGRGIDIETERHGDINVSTARVRASGDAIHTEATDGKTTIQAGTLVSRHGDGIDAKSWDDGDITIKAYGKIFAGDDGIVAESRDNGDIRITTYDRIHADNNGIVGRSGGGDISVTTYDSIRADDGRVIRLEN
jgi:hypothetical protein